MIPVGDELARAAWAQAWQVTTLIVVVAMATRLVARNRPHLAHALWLVVLIKCVTPPVWSSSSGVFCWLQTGSSGRSTEGASTGPPPIAEDQGAATMFSAVEQVALVGDEVSARPSSPERAVVVRSTKADSRYDSDDRRASGETTSRSRRGSGSPVTRARVPTPPLSGSRRCRRPWTGTPSSHPTSPPATRRR